MGSYPINEIFPKCPTDDTAGQINIEDVVLNREQKTLRAVVRFEHFPGANGIRELIKNLSASYGLENVEIIPRYSIAELSRESVRVALGDSILESPAAAALLNGCELKIARNGIRFILKHGASFIPGLAEQMERRLLEVFGERIPVIFENAPVDAEASSDETASEFEKRKERIIGELAEKMPKKTAPVNVIFGKRPSERWIPISDMDSEMGRQTVRGHVFSVENTERTRHNMSILRFDMADETGACRVRKMFKAEDGAGVLPKIKEGMYISVSGRYQYDDFEKDIVLEPDGIAEAKAPPARADNAEHKRVELHLHTKMSALDALIDPRDAVLRAAQWGHRALAITDHGNVQAFPEIMQTADAVNRGRAEDAKLKVLYGIEAYFVNDCERVRSVSGDFDAPLDGEFIAFDIETTGLSAASDRIIEIGAVLFKNGTILESFNTFVDPIRKIPSNITQLTGIDDSMVRGAPKIEQALEAFLVFCGDRVLVAHNASFDIGFIETACKSCKIDFDPTYIDTRNMSRGMLQNVTRFDLASITRELSIPEFNHHRAEHDARAVAEICMRFFPRLISAGVLTLAGLNSYLAGNAGMNVIRTSPVHHMILIAQNQTGLRNLYDLVSLSCLDYFHRFPLVLRSELDKRREGLLVGSACEAGELYGAITAWKSDTELERIASYYDYLEIQPVGNNEFMLRNNKVKSISELQEYNRVIVSLGEKLQKPAVATCDTHFMEPGDARYRNVLMSDYEDSDNQPPLFFRTTEEMLAEFSYLGDKKALDVVVINPNKIADMCEFVRPIRSGSFIPEMENSSDELSALVYARLHELYGETPSDTITERVEFEMKSILGHKFDVNYMAAQKLVSRSMADGYLVGSRGSVGSSVVAFLAGITEVNALPPHYRCPECKWHEFSDAGESGPDLPDKTCPQCGTKCEKDGFDILFATFLGFDGDKMPDIDLNFSGDYQARAHAYTLELFGEGYVFRAGTIGTIAEKNAYGFVKKYAEKRELTLSKAEENYLTKGLVGVKRTTGQHPGGLVIVPRGHDIREFTPIQRPADKSESNIITTHFDYHAIEENLIKLDELGHDDPTILRMLQTLTGIDPQRIPLDDRETMSLFTSTKALGFEGDPILGERATFAVPEFGTKFVRDMLSDTKPTTFNELLRISGLSHGTDVWLGNAKNYVDEGTATLKEVVGTRDDITLFLTSKGFEPKLSFTISESIRKGKGITPEWEAQMRRAEVPSWYIESCKKITYLFPKAHAAAYVLMAFRIAWFKVHSPLAFYCAYFSIRAKIFDAAVMTDGIDTARRKLQDLRSAKSVTDREADMITTLEVVYEFYKRGFCFTPVDLYSSDADRFTILDDDTLVPPFTAIPGFGELAAREIVAARQEGEFISSEDIMRRCPKVGNAAVELLEQYGALGVLPKTNQISFF